MLLLVYSYKYVKIDKMDFVYICRPGRNEELRYSIRSVFENTPVNSVWVVGGKPDWYQGSYIPVEQHKTKYENAKNNLRAIINSEQIPNKFILMNDDFFIIKKIERIPVYHGGLLAHKADQYKEFRATAAYANMLLETVETLRKNGVPNPLDYSIHVPMTINKENLSHSVEVGGAIRSVYGNMNRIGGVKLPADDVKIHNRNVLFPQSFDYVNNEHDLPFLSTSDITFKSVYRNSLRQFSNPSDLEGFSLRG